MDSSDKEMDLSVEEWDLSEMDPADKEPELPSAVQKLIQRLEDKAEPVRRLPRLSSPDLQEFFPEHASLSTIIGWRRKVRLRVLEAIGSCNTFHSLDVQIVFGGDISRLRDFEWGILLRGFRRSTVLRAIRLKGLRWRSLAEVESLCLELEGILKTSSVEDLTIFNCKLSATCFLNLESGLRGNDESKLKSLELHNAWKEDSSAVNQLAHMINSATRLETLEIGRSGGRMYDMDEKYDMDENDARILSQALIKNSSLKTLVLNEVKGEASAFLLKALDAHDGNRAIECLHLTSMSGLGDCLRELLRSNPYLKEVRLSDIDMRPEKWHQLGEAISENATARTICVTHLIRHRDNLKGVEKLACAASLDAKDPRVELKMKFYDYDALMSALNFVGKVLRGQIKSLESLILVLDCSCPSESNHDRMESIVPMDGNPAETSVLKRLRLFVQSRDTLKGVWKYLLCCLRENTSLTHLDLSESDLDDEAFRELMDLLQVNLTLQQIDVSGTAWAKDGKAAPIQEALQENQNRACYMSVFREAKLTFGDAKAGRLFLCGYPKAGKTRLRQTLMRIVKGKTWLGNKLDELLRTQGIEVEFLQNDETRQISIWDFAGQGIFRTLQTVLFPQASNFSVFLFVYNPFCEETSSNKPDTCFQLELEEWLTFITSSTRLTGLNLPQVLVVISHKDKAKYNFTGAQSIADISERFAKSVRLHQKWFHVNALQKKQVIPIKNYIFDIFEELLRAKSPRVPHLCSELTFLLVTKTKKHKKCPIWSSTEFHDFCDPALKRFIPTYSALYVDHSRIITSIISYLNDVGSIIYIPNLKYIIVDPNWLTNTFVGELIALGQHFQAQVSEYFDQTSSYTSKDGFVSDSVFAQLIEEFMRKHPHAQGGVDREVLENILINLDLCFKLEDTSQYFIPSFIPEHASMEKQEHEEGAHESMYWENRDETSQFIGIRIQCQDEKTMSLTDAFFSRFQMFMRHKLKSVMDVSKESVTCSRHYLRLFLDGHQIYVQQERYHKYVDVLMLCSKQKSREEARKYVMKQIVEELISFCASPKGCAGVVLVLGVIQTLCVEMRIPSYLRRAIRIEDLKSKFIGSIKDNLRDSRLDKLSWQEYLEAELFRNNVELFNSKHNYKGVLNYKHGWPLIEGHTKEVVFERAMDLLSERDVKAVVDEIGMQQMESFEQGLIQELESLKEGLITLNNEWPQCYAESKIIVSDWNLQQMIEWEPPSTWSISRASSSVENRSTEQIDQLEQKIDALNDRLRLEMKMEQILSLQQELQSTLSVFMSKVDTLIQYPLIQYPQHARTPKRPYITTEDGVFHRMNALLHVEQLVCIRLMCESLTGFHPVQDQEGLKIRLYPENSSWIWKTIEISYRVMFYVVKAGLDKTLRLGQAIPDWEDLKSDIVDLDGIRDSDCREVLKRGNNMELKEAWMRIQQTLAPQLRDSYSRIFKLFQVKYKRLELGGHAWVCEECLHKGLRRGQICI